MPQQFWMDEYRKKAAMSDAIAQSGRGDRFQPVEFLYVVKRAIELLDLRREHDLLDVGCANGLLDIVLSTCCHTVLAVEPVAELAELARKNLADCPNVQVEIGHGAAIPAADKSFDRVLMLEVAQLVAPDELKAIFCELRRVTRPYGRILIGSVPDARHRDEFLERYLAGDRAATHPWEAKKAEIITRNLRAHWCDPAELVAWWHVLGGQAKLHQLPANDPCSDHRFDLIVSVQK